VGFNLIWAKVFSVSCCAIVLYQLSRGLGRHADTLDERDVTILLELLFANYFLYNTGLSLAKLSVLLFYARIFDTGSSRFRYALYVTHALVLAWLLGICLSTLFLCKPIQKQWLPDIPGTCANTGGLWLGSAIPSVIIDLVILVLPLLMLWRLKTKKSRKLLTIGIFICGYWHVLSGNRNKLTITVLYWCHSEDS
jgi:hypothetical protein